MKKYRCNYCGKQLETSLNFCSHECQRAYEHKIKQIYPKLLEANLQWKETNGSTLGLQQYSEKVLLVQNVPIESCDYSLFNRSLEFFINSFEFWLKNLKDLQAKPEKAREKPVGLLV